MAPHPANVAAMGAGNKHRPAAEIADEIVAVVEERWKAHDDLKPSDLNQVFCYLGYVRAFRCFDSIRLLAAEARSDDALVLTRSLVSVVLRSLYLVQPEDPQEREHRLKRDSHKSRAEEEKRVRMLGDERDAKHLARLQAELDESKRWFEERGLSPGLPGEAEMAKALELDALYDIVYRVGSSASHHSLLYALGGFSGDPEPGQPFPAIPLHKPEPELAENALVWAIIAYHDFIVLAEPTMNLGIAKAVHELVRPWLETHPYRERYLRPDSDESGELRVI